MPSLAFRIVSELEAAGFKDAAAHLRAHNKQLKESKEHSDALGEATADLKSELLGFASVVGVIEFFKSATDAASKNEQAMLQLASTYEATTGKSFSKVAGHVEAFTTALGENTRFSKTESITALDMMTQRTGDLGTAQRLLTDAMGLAIKRHMDLATASDLVAGIQEHQQRATMMVGRSMGLTHEQMKDSATVLGILHQRYGEVAMSEDSFESKQKKLSNSFEEFKVVVGNGIMPVLGDLFDWLAKFIRSVPVFIGQLAAVFTAFADDLVEIFEKAKAIITLHFKDLAVITKAHLASQAALQNEFDQGQLEMDKIWSEKKKDVQEDLLAVGHVKLQKALATSEAMIAKFNATDVVGAKAALDAKVLLLKAESKAQLEQLKIQLEQQKESSETINRVMQASQAANNRALAKLYQDDAKEKIDAVVKSGDEIGQATGKMLAGQQDAWKSGMRAVIDTVIQTTEKIVIANYIAGGSQEVARGGWIGVATGAALIALGFSAAQGVADEVLSGGGGSSTATAPSGAGGAVSAALAPVQASAPAAGSQGGQVTNVTVNVANMYGSAKYADMMARILSDRVVNGGVKLTATGLNG